MDIADTTGSTLPALNKIEDVGRRAVGITKPLLGEGLGARASAAEAIQTTEQGLKPAFEDAKFKAKQILPFIAEWFMEMWREYSDPKRTIQITYQNEVRFVKPAQLWGPLALRVVSIKRFQDSILKAQQEDKFINQFIPAFKDLMSPDGMIQIGTSILKNRDFSNAEKVWKKPSDFDAKHVALSENDQIIWNGVLDYPKPDENHKAHLKEHKPCFATASIQDESAGVHPDGLKNMKTHIIMHEQMMERAESGEQAPTEGQPPVPAATGETPGEIVGDTLAAEAGATENLPGVTPVGSPSLAEI